ncbi:tumor necrosis factor receptor superfamily member 14-like [Danio aesculapii]|uniref:tumor necrosis factor receptor superfamily member 14-like n=1 Tax=Danio aesculapii TaxID=1142201 RepID=UPI0024C013BD|nr:tumor necrosis factor receptor superfamily member 14-like [Danio aesculapii]
MFKFGFFLFIATLVTLNLELCFSACARAEYEINGECCPMCAPGNHVYWHCTIDTSTTCVPCPALTYTDEPNGLERCFACTACDAANGLRVKKTCTRSSDTVCEPLAGSYCIQRNKDGCSFAVEHSKCQPGQYIKQAGTPFTNTECGNCTEGSYSNGSFTTCRPHSNCEKEGRKVKTPGTASSDVECEDSASVAAIVVGTVIGAGFCVLLTAGITTYFKLKPKKPQNSKRDNNHQVSVQESPFVQSETVPVQEMEAFAQILKLTSLDYHMKAQSCVYCHSHADIELYHMTINVMFLISPK